MIGASAERMARMIDQLLDFTRARMGNGIALSPRQCDVTAICRAVAVELQAACVTVAVTIDAVGDTVGQWDPDRLTQLLSNVVGNAIEHGTGKWVAAYVNGTNPGQVTVEVRNRGRVGTELLPGLFDPARNVPRVHPGAGLGIGLYICEQIVRAHGGTIDVSSTDGETTASIVLPREAASWGRVFEGELPRRKGPVTAAGRR